MWQNMTDSSKELGTKVRLTNIFRVPGQTTSDFMKEELSKLTEKDISDFRGWFNAAGFPTK